MATLARLAAILLVTLGFQIHGFVGAITAAHPGACVVAVAQVPAESEAAPLPPEKPSPSCKVIGAAHPGLSGPTGWSVVAVSVGHAPTERASWRPGGPEKPPKPA